MLHRSDDYGLEGRGNEFRVSVGHPRMFLFHSEAGLTLIVFFPGGTYVICSSTSEDGEGRSVCEVSCDFDVVLIRWRNAGHVVVHLA